jgi:methylmalonyl-CoA mutase C-terminal domain/subunit
MAIKTRVVIGKIGLDSHDIGILLLQNALRDAGMEVIYPGKFLTPEQVVQIAIEEDADVIALGDHTGTMLSIAADVVEELKKRGVADSICVVAGGIIPEEDKPLLKRMGVTGLYGQGTPVSVIVDHIKQRVSKMKSKDEEVKNDGKNCCL